MANQIEKFKKYVDYLDEVYQISSTTAVLESNAALAKQGLHANEIIIPKMKMDGLADYDRNGDYVPGNVELKYQPVVFNYDRNRIFKVDAMDDEETAGISFGSLAAEFVRTQVIPEQDAFRFSIYASKAGTKVSGSLSTGASVLEALQNAVIAMNKKEVLKENRHLFITSDLLIAAQNVDSTKNQSILSKFTSITEVPDARFYTAIDFLDGKTSGEEAGGFKKASAGKDINFLIVEKSAVLQFTKHKVEKVISPEDNQSSDKWLFFFREYGLADVYENKVAGIYLHHKA